LQILEDGKLTDAKWRAVDFRNTIIIMTSNIGAQLLNREAALGFRTTRSDEDTKAREGRNHEEMIRKITGELRQTFKPEFLNRIDATIVFHSLRQDQIREIVELMLKRVRAQLIEQEMTLDASDEAKDFLVEKAHPEVFNILLQILEDGKLTDAKGRAVDFRNTIIIMTSNIGAQLLNREAALGFRTTRSDEDTKIKEGRNHEEMIRKITGELRQTFKPEFLNRIDATIVFHSLRQDQIREIVELMLKRVRAQLIEQEMTLDASDEAKDFLVEKGYDALNGARPLRRAIQNFIEDPLAEGLLQGKFHPGDNVAAEIVEGGLVLVSTPPQEKTVSEAVLAESEL
jgi:ATP-dependent Clp protease ATP-binding subunit ClpA